MSNHPGLLDIRNILEGCGEGREPREHNQEDDVMTSRSDEIVGAAWSLPRRILAAAVTAVAVVMGSSSAFAYNWCGSAGNDAFVDRSSCVSGGVDSGFINNCNIQIKFAYCYNDYGNYYTCSGSGNEPTQLVHMDPGEIHNTQNRDVIWWAWICEW